MANKTYTVMKDGEVLRELKTLAAAKKLADMEDAEVFAGGLCVYAPDPPAVTPPSIKYRLLHRMNVRKEPSLDAEILSVLDRGTTVEIVGIRDDWLRLTDGSFILYGAGEFAERLV